MNLKGVPKNGPFVSRQKRAETTGIFQLHSYIGVDYTLAYIGFETAVNLIQAYEKQIFSWRLLVLLVNWWQLAIFHCFIRSKSCVYKEKIYRRQKCSSTTNRTNSEDWLNFWKDSKISNSYVIMSRPADIGSLVCPITIYYRVLLYCFSFLKRSPIKL